MPTVSIDAVVTRANELLREYENAYKEFCKVNNVDIVPYYSFGEWVLQRYYPQVSQDSDRSIRDMCTTERTSDAKTWLIANLRAGRLTLNP